ncbi:hypothetical protein [Chryseobacterium vrystaatense]|uniref:Tetratricopeptide repeat-containing protein n=1 Tax=Chryseobacterium vrystaatense TaxID=307480 RepID=A0ABR4UTK7_9FLAO|nr:hypothetical protein [Chryseobacterium vrystaatense]KFF28470.1 hypothetical protein IW16_04545 [Chryseobacterium vrystaatense]
MNPRVLELLKNPKNIQSEDLGLLKEEIHAFPYVQNIRALHLFGVHLYDKENYQKELSTTAAYTTDKKLLYQLINGKIQREPKSEATEDKKALKTAEKEVKYSYKEKAFPIKRDQSLETVQDKYEKVASMIPPAQEIKHIHINGERNRILFEGEENFLDETNSEVIDLESTLESGVIVTQKTVPVTEDFNEGLVQETETENNKQEKDSEAGVEFTPELIVDEDKIDRQEEELEVDKDEDVSFHEVESPDPQAEIEREKEANTIAEELSVGETEQNLETGIEEENADDPDAEISFHGMDQFLPDVKIQGNSDDEAVAAEVSTPNVNKHEEEMRRLIEEVEKKMKEAQSVAKTENAEPEAVDHEISFAETQNFHFWSTEKEEQKTGESTDLPSVNTAPHTEEKEELVEEKTEEPEIITENMAAWKPMSFESHLPDSMITKDSADSVTKTDITKQENSIAVEEEKENKETVSQATEEPQKEIEKSLEETSVEEDTPEIVEEQQEEVRSSEEGAEIKTQKGEEAPVMNVSFFGSDISSLSVEKTEKENIKETPVKDDVKIVNIDQALADSNVPGFINTWQSWLKIDRPVEEVVEKVETIPVQEKVIEAFIENNPRISQLRDESTYVVKEKNDDISHLMTETLANLYFEQKLYTKAIKAFEILIKKNPEKKDHFQSKIKEIKDFRSKG